MTSYVAATFGALGTALGLNSLVKSLPPLVGRLVPVVACSAANAINIPMMRRVELQNGKFDNEVLYSFVTSLNGKPIRCQ